MTDPTPIFTKALSSRNLDTRSKAFDKSKKPMYKVALLSFTNAIIIRNKNIWSIVPFPF